MDVERVLIIDYSLSERECCWMEKRLHISHYNHESHLLTFLIKSIILSKNPYGKIKTLQFYLTFDRSRDYRSPTRSPTILLRQHLTRTQTTPSRQTITPSQRETQTLLQLIQTIITTRSAVILKGTARSSLFLNIGIL